MGTVIGPILKRADGYGFDTWSTETGVRAGFSYRRIEDAYYDRNRLIKAAHDERVASAIVCQTIDEFKTRLAGRAAA